MTQENIRTVIRNAYATLLLTMQKTTNPVGVRLYNATCTSPAREISNPSWVDQYVKSLQDNCLTKIILEKLVFASLDQNYKGFSSVEIGNLLHRNLRTYTKKYFQTQLGLTSYSEIEMQQLLRNLGLVTPFSESEKDILTINVSDFLKKACKNSYNELAGDRLSDKKVAKIVPDLVIKDDHQIIVLDLTSRFDKTHFQKTKTYAVIIKMLSRNMQVVYGEIYWNNTHAGVLLRKLDSLSPNRQFVREFPVDPGVMDSMPIEQIQTLGRKNPYALSALEHETVSAFDAQDTDLGTIFRQLAGTRSIDVKDIRAALDQL